MEWLEYTPTTEEVLASWLAHANDKYGGRGYKDDETLKKEFYRWLKEVKNEA